MKTYKYKIVSLLLLLAISVQAQKFDKKTNEKFKVNSDVTIIINAAQTDVDIETWNRNEVSIEAVIEVEGVSKKEAEKIFKNWKFEALANKNKVEIVSLSDNSFFEFDGDFDFEFPEMDIEIPHFEMPEFPEIPEIEFEGFDFDYDAYKKDSTYLKKYKFKVQEQVEKFKNSDWKKKLDSVRNSDEFKKKIEELKKATKEIAIEMKELRNSKEFKQSMEEAKRVAEEVRKEMLENKSEFKEQMKGAKEASKMAVELIKKMKEEGKLDSLNNFEEGKLDSLHNFSENIYFGYKTDKNSKVKIKKHLKIKVPKKATFDLNVKHGKLTIPNSNTKISSNVSYGNFIGGIIEGSQNELKFSNSSVVINTLNSGNITLKNVPKAMFGTFENVNIFSNLSDVVIEKVGKNVALSQKFGSLEVLEIVSEFNNFIAILDYTKATLPLGKLISNFEIDTNKCRINRSVNNSDSLKNRFLKVLNKHDTSFNGEITSGMKTSNFISLKGNYSTIDIN